MPRHVSPPSGRTNAAISLIPILAASIVGCGTAVDPPHIAIGRKVPPLDLVPLVDLSPFAEPMPPTVLEPDRRAAPAASIGPTLEGKVSLLNFWGTWCPPCRRELPGLVRLAARLDDHPHFQLVAVSCGTGPRDELEVIRGETRAFLRERSLDLTVWADPDGRTRFQFAATMDFSAYPTTYLIGPDATVRRVWVGYRSRDEADIAASVVALLRSVPGPSD